jgi:hypothetical protein
MTEPLRPYLPSTDPDDEGCARVDCPAAGGSGEGCEECAGPDGWWDGEKREVRQ